VVRYLDLLLRYLLILMVGTLTVTVFLQVLLRFIFLIPIPWTEEVARISFVYSIYLGAVLGIRDRSHIRVDILMIVMPPLVRRAMQVFGTIAVAVFLVFMTWQGVELISRTGAQLTPVMQLPFRHIFIIIPMSGALMLLYLVLGVIDDLRAWRAS
jgi:TRAP-type C4-dicarboxylate transport system permease small subunit